MSSVITDPAAGSLELRPAPEGADLEALAPTAVAWILETDPTLTWFYGGAEAAARHVGEMVRRPTSELSLRHAVVLWRGDRPAGMYLALPQAELEASLLPDARAMLQRLERHERPVVIQKLAALRGFGRPVGAGEFFLSKLVIGRESRGLGLGRLLLEAFLDTGRGRGFKRFSLRVLTGNALARRLYESVGFADDGVVAHPEPALSMFSMVLDETAG
jgi:GNAT superfamily N-acetyltransferase